jgi:hypothetical protein
MSCRRNDTHRYALTGIQDKAYSIAAHSCGRFAQCSNTIYSMTDFDKGLEAQESSHAVAAKWKISSQFTVLATLF